MAQLPYPLRRVVSEQMVSGADFKHIQDISEVPKHLLLEIRRFFEDYKKNENKEVQVRLVPHPAARTPNNGVAHSFILLHTA